MLKNQEQHRIPQVYWRQWCFRDSKTNAETLSVLAYGQAVSHYVKVKRFTAVTNLFDTTLFEPGSERFFDKMCIRTESNYQKVIKALNTGEYDPQTRIYLTEFVSNIFVRQQWTYDFFTWILERKHIRKKLFREISILDNDNENGLIEKMYEEMAIDPEHTMDSKVSAVLVQAWKHFKTAFQRFNHIIVKAPVGRFWNTTDNPVIVHNMGNDGWVAGPECEIYFPISKDFLLYMHVDKVKKENTFISLPENKISEISIDDFDHVALQVIAKSKCNYHVIGENIGYYNASTGVHEERYTRPQSPDNGSREDYKLVGTPYPPAPDDQDLLVILKRLKTDAIPTVVKVDTHADARENECIEIVDKMVSLFGGERILGWQIWQGGFLIEAEFHAVWQKDDGQIIDVSIKKNKIPAIVFVPDKGLQYKGKQINSVRVNLTKNPVVDDFIRLWNIRHKLLNKGKRSELYGEELWRSLTSEQQENIRRVLKLIALLEQFLESGADEDTLCFCRSGRKYKNCHTNHIKLAEAFS
jgi:hypothetical protein